MPEFIYKRTMISAKIKQKIIDYFKSYKPVKIGVFGSFARNENTPKSDIDILINFKNTISLFQLVKFERELSELLGIKVDLVTENALKNWKLKQYIEKDLQIIYQ